MGLFTNFKKGFNTYGQAHRFILKNRLWPYVLIPALINIILILVLIFGGWQLIGKFTDYIFEITGLSGTPEGFFKYLVLALQWVLRLLLHFILILFYVSIYRYIVLILVSPALAILSEKCVGILTGTTNPFHLGRFIHDVGRGILIALRNSLIEFMYMILLFFVSFIPVIGFFSPVVLFFITCYFYGFSMIDYSNELYRMNIRQSVRFVRKNMGLSIANGMVFYFIFFFIPVIGFMIAPAYAVVAATLAVHQVRTSALPEKKS